MRADILAGHYFCCDDNTCIADDNICYMYSFMSSAKARKSVQAFMTKMEN